MQRFSLCRLKVIGLAGLVTAAAGQAPRAEKKMTAHYYHSSLEDIRRPATSPTELRDGHPATLTAGRELEWVELRPELVIEVSYDHVSGGRIRHGTRVVRWRDDRDPKSCSLDQLA